MPLSSCQCLRKIYIYLIFGSRQSALLLVLFCQIERNKYRKNRLGRYVCGRDVNRVALVGWCWWRWRWWWCVLSSVDSGERVRFFKLCLIYVDICSVWGLYMWFCLTSEANILCCLISLSSIFFSDFFSRITCTQFSNLFGLHCVRWWAGCARLTYTKTHTGEFPGCQNGPDQGGSSHTHSLHTYNYPCEGMMHLSGLNWCWCVRCFLLPILGVTYWRFYAVSIDCWTLESRSLQLVCF